MRPILALFLAACGGSAINDRCSSFAGRQWGTSEDDEALALVPARSGGVYTGGFSGGRLGTDNIGPTGNSRGFVRKLSASGEVQWEATLDTSATDIVEALAESPAGRIYAAGRTTGAFGGATQRGQFDAFTAVLTSAGTVSAVTQFGDE